MKRSESDQEEQVRTTDGKPETGTIEEVLPRAMFRVRLDDGRTVRAGLSAASRHAVVRLIEGYRVSVRLSPHDPSRGQIVRRL